jgi:hypothetical protein
VSPGEETHDGPDEIEAVESNTPATWSQNDNCGFGGLDRGGWQGEGKRNPTLQGRKSTIKGWSGGRRAEETCFMRRIRNFLLSGLSHVII